MEAKYQPKTRKDEAPRHRTANTRVLRHGIWLHPEVSDELRQWPHLYQRLGLILKQLAARGETSVVKSCRNTNRGWLRSPLGGHNGRQYYLWWTHQGSRWGKNLEAKDETVIVRAVRHHDDHTPLGPGKESEYLRLEQAGELNEDMAGEPWTAGQRKFAHDRSPVRLLIGRPGSGKTTALWQAIEARAGEQILYLTWSTALRQNAEAHFASFAPDDITVDTMDFQTFVGEIAGSDIERQTLGESQRRLDEAVTKAGRNMAGPWASRLKALHAELRAALVGRALPGWKDTTEDGTIWRLDDEGFKKHRSPKTTMDTKAARALLKVARTLPRGTLAKVYPEIAAAQKAIQTLATGKVPERFRDTNRIVVDEAQDLTIVELKLISTLCHRIADDRGWSPWLLIAGDAGQTVRPTGFNWNQTAAMLSRELGPTKSFHLDGHVRCPRRIAEIVDRSAELYARLNKEIRPEKQHRQTGAEHVDAHVMHVAIADADEAERLTRHVANADHAVMITTNGETPDWVPAEHRQAVLTPADAKGLEYQTVCVLDGGRALADLRDRTTEEGTASLGAESARTAIDGLRVALSRATEGLALVDMQPGPRELDAGNKLLDRAASWSGDDLVEYIRQRDTPTDESVRTRIRDAMTLLDTAPARAWQRAVQGIQMLGNPEQPNGVNDTKLRKETRTALLRTAARLVVTAGHAGVEFSEIYTNINEAVWLDAANETRHGIEARSIEARTLQLLHQWCTKQEGAPSDLLVSLLVHLTAAMTRITGESTWTDGAVPIIRQRLRKELTEGADNPETARFYNTYETQAWLLTTGHKGKTGATAKGLAQHAFDTLIQAAKNADHARKRRDRLEEAERILYSLGDDALREGRLHEAAGNLDKAVDAYSRAGAKDDRMRVWRNNAKWEDAVKECADEPRRDLEWLLKLEAMIETRPRDQNRRLRKSERKRLSRLLNRIQRQRDVDEE